MKMRISFVVIALLLSTPVSAQSVLRQRVENAGSHIGQIFASDKDAAEIRALRTSRSLKQTLINTKRLDVEVLELELLQIDQRLAELGVGETDEPAVGVLSDPAAMPTVPLDMSPITSCELAANGDCILK